MKKNGVFYIMLLLIAVLVSGCANSVKTVEESKTDVKSTEPDKSTEPVRRTRKETAAKSVEETTKAVESPNENREIVNMEYENTDISEEIEQRLPAKANLEYVIDFKKLTLKSGEYKRVSEALEQYRAGVMQEAEKYLRQAFETVGSDASLSIYIVHEPKVIRADSSVLSVEWDLDFGVYGNEEVGEALDPFHNISVQRTLNFDVSTGKEIAFDAIVKDKNALFDAVKTLTNEIPYDDSYRAITESDVAALQTDEYLQFAIGYDTLSIRHRPSEEDHFDWMISVPYKEYPELFAPDYTKVPKSYITYLDAGDLGHVDLNLDGKEDIFRLNHRLDGVGLTASTTGFKIATRDKVYDFNLDAFFYDIEGAVARLENGRKFLYLTRSMEAFSRTYIVDLNTGGELKLGEEMENLGFLRDSFDPNRITTYSLIDLVGTSHVYYDGRISEDGKIVFDTELAYFRETAGGFPVRKDFYGTKVDDDFNEIEQDSVIRAGEIVKPAYTNGKDFVIFRCEDGRLIKVNVFNYKINGEDVEELLEGIIFAG